jgi:hypothetical protein
LSNGRGLPVLVVPGRYAGFERDRYETLVICRQLAYARAVFKIAIEEKPAGKFMIRSRCRVVKRHPEGDW